MDISTLRPKDVFNEKDLKYYKKGMRFFYLNQLVPLNVNIHIMDHVLTFPFRLFSGPEGSLFFRMVFENFYYSSLLIITRITTDQGADVFILPRFKNEFRQLIKPGYREAIDEHLRQVKFDDVTQRLFEKARQLRNERVAHVLKDVVFSPQKETLVTFGEIKSMRDELERLLDALSLNVRYYMLPPQYSPEVQHPHGIEGRSDIEMILDDIARRSTILNLPETNPSGWNIRKDGFSKMDIEILNEYRRKFGLVEV